MHLIDSLDQVHSYVKNSKDITLALRCLIVLDDNVFLFTADTTAIYPNINIEERLTFLTLSLENLIFKVGLNGHRKEIINTMKLLLIFNVFQFRETYYRQKEGGEMGSPFACL